MSTKFSKELCLKCLCQIFELIKLEFCLPNSVRNYAAKISDVYKSLINNSRKKIFHIKISTFSKEGFMRKNCPQISVRIYVEFWVGLDARKFSKELCHRNFHFFPGRMYAEKLSTNFGKDWCLILSSFRCQQIQ